MKTVKRRKMYDDPEMAAAWAEWEKSLDEYA
jgi:hypothetical protein